MNASTDTPAPAISYPDTSAAVGGNGFGRLVLLWFGLLGAVFAVPGVVLCIELGDPEYPALMRRTADFGVMLCILLFCLGPVLSFYMWRKRRIERILRTHPWVVWRVDYECNPTETIVLRDAQDTPISRLTISSSGSQRRAVVDEKATHVWFAGDPLRRGVIARPGGSYPLYVFGSPIRSSGVVPKPKKPQLPLDLPPHLRPGRTRRTAAFCLDLLVHLGCGVAVGIAAAKPTSAQALIALDFDIGRVVLPFLGAWAGASFINRVLLQSVAHTTLGKAVFGLCAIDPETLGFPTFGRLTGAWFMGLYLSAALPLCVVTFSDVPGPDEPKRYLLPAIRHGVPGGMAIAGSVGSIDTRLDGTGREGRE
ncbi:hypothetical protein HGA13_20675 [Nocardia speluncae]|uniref:RDD family protein n=1 Tax=Nocardia speluncae TaxID=419477 RepID=A0A846XJE8_9NOCA|nr:RDD family protein [Nocardia speluncae]NKY35465.1 hypothetical protein [Nocardia speluncae]